ncbi:ECF-type sigma factor [Hydrocarboniphaga sp.]|uniref:ECF-type sigma factor n=1 Tax=Hydrocarboniphaga sp. TaxID=2033016 RepID=UPI003D1267E4
MGEITELLDQVRLGQSQARNQLFERVYTELCALARAKLARESTFTNLDASGLVHETYLRLGPGAQLQEGDRRSFYAYAATIMRSIIVDEARRRGASKRGGDQVQVTLLTSLQAGQAEEQLDIEALDAALQQLKQIDERCHQVVELRYFAGLGIEEVAELLELSPATVKREWQKARAFLFRALHSG